MNNESLRILILKMLRAVGATGMTQPAIAAQIALEFPKMNRRRIEESVAYLVDRDFARTKKSPISSDVRIRIAPEGLDFLDENGL